MIFESLPMEFKAKLLPLTRLTWGELVEASDLRTSLSYDPTGMSLFLFKLLVEE